MSLLVILLNNKAIQNKLENYEKTKICGKNIADSLTYQTLTIHPSSLYLLFFSFILNFFFLFSSSSHGLFQFSPYNSHNKSPSSFLIFLSLLKNKHEYKDKELENKKVFFREEQREKTTQQLMVVIDVKETIMVFTFLFFSNFFNVVLKFFIFQFWFLAYLDMLGYLGF